MVKWSISDKELIQRFQKGDTKSFDELVKKYYPQSYQFFCKMVRDPMQVDDLCQETYLRVYKGLKKFRLESQFTTWLYRISINVANSYFRRRRLFEPLPYERNLDQIIIDEPEKNSIIDFDIWRVIGKLPKKQRMVIILRVFQQLSFKDIAGVIGLSENSAKVNYHYAINKMKEILEVN